MQQCSIQSLLLHGSVCICSVPQLTDVKHGVKKAGKVPRGGGRVSHYRCVLWEMLRRGLQPSNASYGAIRVYWDELIS